MFRRLAVRFPKRSFSGHYEALHGGLKPYCSLPCWEVLLLFHVISACLSYLFNPSMLVHQFWYRLRPCLTPSELSLHRIPTQPKPWPSAGFHSASVRPSEIQGRTVELTQPHRLKPSPLLRTLSFCHTEHPVPTQALTVSSWMTTDMPLVYL